MSRAIDLTNPEAWTDEEIQYLAARDQLPKEMADLFRFDPEAHAVVTGGISNPADLTTQAHTGTVNSAGLSPEEYERAVELLRAEQEEADGPPAEADDEGEEEDYDEGWNNDQRRAELSSRGLSTEGDKATMIERLLESDASSDEEGEG